MADIEKYKPRALAKLKIDLASKLLSVDQSDSHLELIISIEEKNINLKELSTYLELIYRLDGYLSDKGLFQYSHYPIKQIEISEIRLGSWEVVFKEVLNSINAERLAIIWLVLKYLPRVTNSIFDIGIKFYELQNKREDFLEKRDKRKFRRNIRDAVVNDPDLSKSLDKKTREKVVDILDNLYSANGSKLAASNRFDSKSIKSVKLKSRGK